MTEEADWLPPLKLLEDCCGDWSEYEEVIYRVFCDDFISSSPVFRGVEVKYFSNPVSKGKVATFWHITSEGKDEATRVPDIRRCERIAWARAVIENADTDARVLVWQNYRDGKPRMCLWLEEKDYVAVLGSRGQHYVLITAYCELTEWRKTQFRREYEDSSA